MQSADNGSEHRESANAVEQNARGETLGEVLGVATRCGTMKPAGKVEPSAHYRAYGKTHYEKHRILALRQIGDGGFHTNHERSKAHGAEKSVLILGFDALAEQRAQNAARYYGYCVDDGSCHRSKGSDIFCKL